MLGPILDLSDFRSTLRRQAGLADGRSIDSQSALRKVVSALVLTNSSEFVIKNTETSQLWHMVCSSNHRCSIMNRKLTLLLVAVMTTVGVHAQGRGRGQVPPPSSPGNVHSNAPAGTPSASADRDFGRDRASDVGKGKK